MKNFKRILSLITLIMLLSGLAGFNINSVQAATYSSDLLSITLPDEYEKNYKIIDENFECAAYQCFGEKYYSTIDYVIGSKAVTEYTQEHLNEFVENLEELFDYIWIDFIHKEFVEINGCKGIRIAFETYSYDANMYDYQDRYYLVTDNYQIELSFVTGDPNFIDSNEQKAIVKSFKIKDTVLKSRGIPFTDVPTNAWYFNAVKFNYTNNMIKGLNDYTYGPSANLTRGMLVTILWRMEGNPKANSNLFKDVSASQYYYNAVNWAASNKIISGYGEGKFGPNDNITREQLAVILRNYAQFKKKNVSARTDLTKFADNAKISSYAKDAVSWAVSNKIISGKSNGTQVDPHGKATRAEVAAMLYNYCMNIK